MIAGDLGRFGSGGPYEEYSQFYEKNLHQHGQVKNHACIFICEFVSNANRANFLTKLGFEKTSDRCNFGVRTKHDLRKTQQSTRNYGKVSTRTKAHSNRKQEVQRFSEFCHSVPSSQ